MYIKFSIEEIHGNLYRDLDGNLYHFQAVLETDIPSKTFGPNPRRYEPKGRTKLEIATKFLVATKGLLREFQTD